VGREALTERKFTTRSTGSATRDVCDEEREDEDVDAEWTRAAGVSETEFELFRWGTGGRTFVDGNEVRLVVLPFECRVCA
jgi:hypothetical protein